jgi:hypothetical protein
MSVLFTRDGDLFEELRNMGKTAPREKELRKSSRDFERFFIKC